MAKGQNDALELDLHHDLFWVRKDFFSFCRNPRKKPSNRVRFSHIAPPASPKGSKPTMKGRGGGALKQRALFHHAEMTTT